jgi:hypothetical protein
MKKISIFLFLVFLCIQLNAQNSVSIDAGYLRTHTSAAEYLRDGSPSTLLDYVTLKPDIGSFQTSVAVNIGLGKSFFLSTGFHYAQKGMQEVSVHDTATTYFVKAAQHYFGLSMMIEYHYIFRKSRFGLMAATGPQVDFAVGKPNNGSLYSGTFSKYFMPFSRFSETDVSWTVEAGATYKLGPGNVFAKLCYRYGLSDMLEDAFIIGRSASYGVSVGYSVNL